MSKATFSKKSSTKKLKKKNHLQTRPSFKPKSVSSSSATTAVSSCSSRAEPWNHKQFLQRVWTFNSLKWHSKRTDINPLICARFGWECVGSNSLQCTGCGTKVDYKTNPIWTAEIIDKAAASFLENIKTRHTAECIWRENPCDESFECLPTDCNVLKQQLIENMRSWAVTDGEGQYHIPKLDPKAKQLMMHSIEALHGEFEKERGSASWTQYAHCCTLMLLAGSGWNLKTKNKTLHFVECQYCNKCISLQSYECKKMVTILPENIHDVSYSNHSNSFLNAIDEEDDDDEEREVIPLDEGADADQMNWSQLVGSSKMEADSDESDAPELDISAILCRELPLNDTDSVMHRLSRLGLKIDVTIRRSHNFQIYETRTLQKQAHFSSTDSVCSSTPSSSMSMSATPPPVFGLTPVVPSFGSMGSSALNWPKMSVFNSPAASVSNSNTNSATNSAVKADGKKKKKRKRSRVEMEQMNPVKEDEEMDLLLHHDGSQRVNGGTEPSRKKMKIDSKADECNENENGKPLEKQMNGVKEEKRECLSKAAIKKKKRRNRKRKTPDLMEDPLMGPIAEEPVVPSKRRRISTESDDKGGSKPTESPSVSSTVSITPSRSQSTESADAVAPLKPMRKAPNRRKSRKRAFGDVFNHPIDEGRAAGNGGMRMGTGRGRGGMNALLDIKEGESDDDEDDDLQREQKDTISCLMPMAPPKKRQKVHVDTPNVGRQLYFDPIQSHNEHCPFLRMHHYLKEEVKGYVYALRLLPKDVMYIKQIAEQNKDNEAKER